MRTILLVALLACSVQPLSAQLYVGPTDINALDDVYYLQIDLRCLFGGFYVATVDYGQPDCPALQQRPCRISLENGDQMQFSSKMAVFNFLRVQGWEFVETYQTGDADGLDAIHLFRRKPSSGDH